MARYDKYDPKSGGFRAPLAADLPATSKTGNGNPLGVGLDANGRVVPGASASGIKGALVTTRNMKAGDVVDVMTGGEIVELAGIGAGSNVFAAADGVLSTTDTGVYIGHTVEATRLVVRTTPAAAV